MADIKWSAFPNTAAAAASGDFLVGLHSGDNSRFTISATATALAIAQWGANANLSANNFLAGYATTATAAGNTVLTVASAYRQFFTGATTQTVTMPVVSTLALGQTYLIVNNSSGAVTVNSSGGNAIQVMDADSSLLITAISLVGTTAASWNASYVADNGLAGAVLLAPSALQTITGFDLVVNTVRVGLGASSIATNTAVGVSSLNAVTTAANSAGIGYQSLLALQSGDNNTAVGSGALKANISGINNTGMGYLTGQTVTTGHSNTFLGAFADASTNAGIGLIAIGRAAVAITATGPTSGDTGAGISIGSASFPVGVRGNGTVYPSTSGAGFWRPIINGTAYQIPLYADGSTSTGAVLLAPAGDQTITVGNLSIGAGSLVSGLTAGGSQGSLVLYPTTTLRGLLQFLAVDNAANYNITIQNAIFGQTSTLTIPDPGAASASFAYTNSTSSGYVLLAPAALQTITNFDLVINSVRAGVGTGTSTTDNTVFGAGALAARVSGGNTITAIGARALGLTTTPGFQNIAIGDDAIGGSAAFTGTANVIIGSNALYQATTAEYNTAAGFNALTAVTTANENVSIGKDSGRNSASGSVALISGSNNTLLGTRASTNSNAAIGAIAIGSDAVGLIATGSTSGTNGPGISIGSSSFRVGFRGDGSIFPSTSGAGFWQPRINGTTYAIPLYAAGSTETGAVLLAPSGAQTITGFGLTVPSLILGSPLPIASGGTAVTSVTTAPTASSFAGWDASSNLSANNFLGGFATTVSAAGTTTLTVTSAYNQQITGSTTQTIQLPVVSTLALGTTFKVINNSSGVVTVNSSGANLVLSMAANTSAFFTSILNTGTSAASWNASYIFDAGGGVLSITGTANQVIASASTGAVTLSLPQDIGTASNVTFGSVTAPGDFLINGTGEFRAGSAAGGYAGLGYIQYSPTANTGFLQIYCPNQGGNHGNVLTTVATSTGRVWTLPDVTGTLVLSPSTVDIAVTGSGTFRAGVSGSTYSGAGYVQYSPTANLGLLQIFMPNNAGNFGNVLTTASTSAARTWTLPDSTGTIALVGGALGAASATSLTFTSTSGIIGTTTNDNAAAGSVGEISSSANATGVAMTSAAVTQIQTLSLGAGDWDVWCTFYTTVNAATVSQQIVCQLHTATATIADPTTAQLASIASAPAVEVTGQATYLSTGISRWSLSGATTVYLNAVATYSVNTLTGNGMIHARRRR